MLPISEIGYFQDLAFLQSIIDSIQEGVVVQDREGKIIRFNQKATAILGLSPDQLLGKTSYDPGWQAVHLDGTQAPGHTHPVSITLKTGKPQNNVILGVKAGITKTKWLSVNSRLITVSD